MYNVFKDAILPNVCQISCQLIYSAVVIFIINIWLFNTKAILREIHLEIIDHIRVVQTCDKQHVCKKKKNMYLKRNNIQNKLYKS